VESHEKAILTTLLNEVMELRREVQAMQVEDSRRFELITGRIASLEIDGSSARTIRHLESLDTSFAQHVEDECEWQGRVGERLLELDRKQDEFQSNFIDSMKEMNILTRDLGNTRAEIISRGQVHGLKAGALVSFVVSIVVGVVNAFGFGN